MAEVAIDESFMFYINPAQVKVRDELPRVRKDLGELDKMINSIKSFGQIQPIVINRDMELIAGGRRLAACLMGGLEVRACYSDAIDPIKMRELELEENVQRKALTPAEEAFAVKELHELKQKLYGASTSGKKGGWTLDDTAALVGKTRGSVIEDLFLADVVQAFPDLAECKTKSDIRKAAKGIQKTVEQVKSISRYEDTIKSNNKLILIHKDFREHIKGIGEGTVDLILTDPPYGIDIFENAIGIGGETGGENTSAGFKYEDGEDNAKSLLTYFASESYRITKDNAHAYVFCAPSHFWWLKEEMASNGWIVRERPIIWIKRETGQCNQPSMWPASAYEFILFARKTNSSLCTEGRIDWIQCDPVLPNEKLHQAEKPVELLKELITRTSLPGEVVYDPFMGSGSSAEAAMEMKLLFIGCELLEEAYAATLARMSKWLGKGE